MNLFFAGNPTEKERKQINKLLLSYYYKDQVIKYINKRKEEDDNKNK